MPNPIVLAWQSAASAMKTTFGSIAGAITLSWTKLPAAPSGGGGGSAGSGLVATNVSASDGQTNAVTITWQQKGNAKTARVWRSNQRGLQGSVIATVAGPPYVDQGVLFGTVYWYSIDLAAQNGVFGSISAQDSGYAIAPPVPPQPPSTVIINSFVASPPSINQGDTSALSWLTSNATSVTLQTGTGPAVPVPLASSQTVAPASNTSYTLTATNGTQTVRRTLTITVNVPIPPQPPTGTDFVARRNAPGVIRWHKFDTGIGTSNLDSFPVPGFDALGGPLSSNFAAYSYGYSTAVAKPIIDTSQFASGNASMLIPILQGPAQTPGNFMWFFYPDTTTGFGAGQRFFFQYLVRFDQNWYQTVLLAIDGTPIPEQKNFFLLNAGGGGNHDDNSMQLVVAANYYGAKIWNEFGDDQNGGSFPFFENDNIPQNQLTNCTTGAAGNCVNVVPNQWLCVELEVYLPQAPALPTPTSPRYEWPNSEFKIYVAPVGQAPVLLHYWRPGIPNYKALDAGAAGTLPPQPPNAVFGKVSLDPHMTNKSATQQHPTLNIWYDELIVGTSFIPFPGQLPAWRASMTNKDTWYSISGTASMNGVTAYYTGLNHSSVDQAPGPIDLWCGVAASSTTLYSTLGSGDGAWVNGVFAFDLSQSAPQWAQLKATTAWTDVNVTSAYYNDGNPVGRHTYSSQQFIPAAQSRDGKDKVMVFTDFAAYGVFAGGQFGGGNQVDGFNIATAAWDAAGTWADLPGPVQQQQPSICKNESTGDVFLSNGILNKWTCATGTWSVVGTNPPPNTSPGNGGLFGWQGFPSLVDVKRGRVVCIHDGRPYYNVGQIRSQYVLLSTNDIITTPVTGDLAALYGDPGGSIVHDLDNDRYVLFTPASDGASTRVFAINPDTWVSTALPSSLLAPVHTPYARAWYFKQFGGIAYQARFDSNMQFMPTR